MGTWAREWLNVKLSYSYLAVINESILSFLTICIAIFFDSFKFFLTSQLEFSGVNGSGSTLNG